MPKILFWNSSVGRSLGLIGLSGYLHMSPGVLYLEGEHLITAPAKEMTHLTSRRNSNQREEGIQALKEGPVAGEQAPEVGRRGPSQDSILVLFFPCNPHPCFPVVTHVLLKTHSWARLSLTTACASVQWLQILFSMTYCSRSWFSGFF